MKPSGVPLLSSLSKKKVQLPFTSPIEHIICLDNHTVWVYFDNQHSLTFNCLNADIIRAPRKMDYECLRVAQFSRNELAIYAWEKRQFYIYNVETGVETPLLNSRLPTSKVCSDGDFSNETKSRSYAIQSEVIGLPLTSLIVLKENKEPSSQNPTIILTVFNREKGNTLCSYELKTSQPSAALFGLNKRDSVVILFQDTGPEGTLNFFYWSIKQNRENPSEFEEERKHVTVKGFLKETTIVDCVQWSKNDLAFFGNPGEENTSPFISFLELDKILSEKEEESVLSSGITLSLEIIKKEFNILEVFVINEALGQILLFCSEDPVPFVAKLSIIDKSVIRVDAKKEVNEEYFGFNSDGKAKYFLEIEEPASNQYTLNEPSYFEFETGILSNRMLCFWLMRELGLTKVYGVETSKEIIEFLDEN